MRTTVCRVLRKALAAFMRASSILSALAYGNQPVASEWHSTTNVIVKPPSFYYNSRNTLLLSIRGWMLGPRLALTDGKKYTQNEHLRVHHTTLILHRTIVAILSSLWVLLESSVAVFEVVEICRVCLFCPSDKCQCFFVAHSSSPPYTCPTASA